MDNEKDSDEVNAALLGGDEINSPERYPTSQFRQFWTVLKRTLLFSRRDWVRKCKEFLMFAKDSQKNEDGEFN